MCHATCVFYNQTHSIPKCQVVCLCLLLRLLAWLYISTCIDTCTETYKQSATINYYITDCHSKARDTFRHVLSQGLKLQICNEIPLNVTWIDYTLFCPY